jgi:hypothetical protein
MKGSHKVFLAVVIVLELYVLRLIIFNPYNESRDIVGVLTWVYINVNLSILAIWEMLAYIERDLVYKEDIKDLTKLKVKNMPWWCYSPLFTLARSIDYVFKDND